MTRSEIHTHGSTHGDDNHSESSHDEPECRVCRAPAELPEYPLYRACKCSGSIGWVHQDCLTSWLDAMANSGRGTQKKCELCHYPFKFEPLYAPDTPDELPLHMVAYGILHKAYQSWLPATARLLVCLALWFGVMPLLSAHLYLSWMHKPSFLGQRFSIECLRLDWVGGMVVAALIIVSFLSLMNFAEFVRVEMQPPAQERRRLLREFQHARNGIEQALPPLRPPERQIDNELWVQAQQAVLGDRAYHQHVPGLAMNRPDEEDDEAVGDSNGSQDENIDDDDDDDDEDDDSYSQADDEDDDSEDDHLVYSESDDDEAGDNPFARDNDPDHFDFNNARMQELFDAMRQRRPDMQIEIQNVADNNNDGRRLRIEMNAPLNPPPPPPPPAGFDDGADMDLNIAVDELLGLRGPLNIVFRNLLWLMAFNAIYLGFFLFTPRIVGMAVSSIVFNTTSPLGSSRVMLWKEFVVMNSTLAAVNATTIDSDELWRQVMANISSPMDVIQAVELQSEIFKTTFRLSDIFRVLLGYLACAAVVLFLNFLWLASERFEWMRTGRGRRETAVGNNQINNNNNNNNNNPNMDDVRVALEEFNRMLDLAEANLAGEQAVLDDGRGMSIVFALGVVLKAMTAVVKVGVLLLLKMFFLPVSLGLFLDASTLALLGGSLEDRIKYAGSDLFSCTLLHWVAGITFMLLVTVSVLQLREVMHPDLLAQQVRPQEPQPDLLGNLLHESVSTHMRRMSMSLVVYACLLSMHIYLPIRLSLWAGFQPSLKFSFVLIPQLQVPLELLFFHLCMLGLLEKNKNVIGEMQHYWLKFMCSLLNMTDCMLPRSVSKFRLCGMRFVYVSDTELDPFWQELAKYKAKEQRDYLETHSCSFATDLNYKVYDGETKPDGTRVLHADCDFIRLPIRVPGRALRCRSMLLPTKIGRFRLVRGEDTGGNHIIELWEELVGDPIPRPPEGWDDLGNGGAFEQGRWSWGREKKSLVEQGVAHRQPFFRNQRNVFVAGMKLAFLAVATWIATSVMLATLVVSPLAIGRFLLCIARIPDSWVHDPFAFGLGSLFFFPLLNSLFNGLVKNAAANRLSAWWSRFRLPPVRKTMVLSKTAVLFFGLVPLLIGSIVDLAMIKPRSWFLGAEPWVEPKVAFVDWQLGGLMLFVWVQYCRFGIVPRQIIRFLALAPPGNDRAAQDNANRAAAELQEALVHITGALPWRGEIGRTHRFVNIWKAVLIDCEFDKIDPAVLLDDFCYPMVRGLWSVLFWPLFALGVIHLQTPSLVGVLRVLLVRGVLVASFIRQTSPFWIKPAHAIFVAAQKAARDDLYLLGEVLKSYSG